MKKAAFIIAILSMTSISFAAKYAGEFLEIGVGARALSMGGAMTAHVDDGSAFYWNPAGASYISGVRVSGMYADLWDGLANYSTAGVSLPVTGSVFSINWLRLGVPDIEMHPDYEEYLQRDPLLRYVVQDGDTTYYNSVQEYLLATHGAPDGFFSDGESAVFLTFSKPNSFTLDLGWSYFQVPMEMPIGASVKIINQKIGSTTGTGIGADFGMQFRFPLDLIVHEKWKAKFAYGFTWQDATRTAIDWGESNKDAIPPNLRSGISLRQKLPGKQNEILFSYDTEKRWDRTRHLGVEYSMANVLSLRGGYWGEDWTAGAGISIWQATVDYAYLSKEIGVTHRVSFSIRIR
ncbi:hypothetical protein EH220_05490 [bacterium]|nr:MAG: hypothetical protein EH220_05490 [bacterium]